MRRPQAADVHGDAARGELADEAGEVRRERAIAAVEPQLDVHLPRRDRVRLANMRPQVFQIVRRRRSRVVQRATRTTDVRFDHGSLLRPGGSPTSNRLYARETRRQAEFYTMSVKSSCAV